jgi:hypothetical protein
VGTTAVEWNMILALQFNIKRRHRDDAGDNFINALHFLVADKKYAKEFHGRGYVLTHLKSLLDPKGLITPNFFLKS